MAEIRTIEPSASPVPTGPAAILVVLCACWGLQQVAIKVANADISPVLQASFRSLGAVALLMVWAAVRRQRLFGEHAKWPWALAIGLMFTLNHIALFVGLGLTSASRGVVLYYTAPFLVALGAHFTVAGERLSVRGVIGLAMAFVGAGLVLSGRGGDGVSGELLGDLLCLAGAVLWAATIVTVKASPLVRESATTTLFYQLAVSALLLPVISWAMGESGLSDPGLLAWSAVLYQIVAVAFVSYLAWYWLVKHYPAVNVSAFLFLTPVFGVIAGVTLLGEPLTAIFVGGSALVAAGIYVVNS